MINPQIKEVCKQHGIDYLEAIFYLIAVYEDLIIPAPLSKILEKTIKQVNVVHIVDRDFMEQNIKWNVPLFVGIVPQTEWDWVDTEYRKLFKDIRPDRGGTIVSCVSRMKDLFATKPSIRKEDVLLATKLYLKELTDPQYLQGADYFIRKGMGVNITSKLSEYLERVKRIQNVKEVQTSKKMGE